MSLSEDHFFLTQIVVRRNKQQRYLMSFRLSAISEPLTKLGGLYAIDV